MPASDDKFLPGDRVLALRKSGARYLATVATSNRDGSYSVRWDSGETRESRQSPTSLTRISQNNGGIQDDDSCAVRQACRTTTAKIPVRSTKAEEDALLASLGCRLTAAQLLALPRYVRLVQGKRTTITASTLRDELNAMGVAPGEVDHTPLPDFFALPAELSIAPLASHRSYAVVRQDLSSGVAVRVLLSEVVLHNTSCHVLELCCAPGGKLLYTAEVLLQSSTAAKAKCGDRTVTGVDICRARLNQCRGAVRRHKLPNVRLVEADARTFRGTPPPPSEFVPGMVHQSCLPERKQRQLWQRKQREKARLSQHKSGQHSLHEEMEPQALSQQHYDAVLVDAECSADGSVPHMRHMLQLLGDATGKGSASSAHRLDAAKSYYREQSRGGSSATELRDLQAALLANGFTMLAMGGALLYLTCSGHACENEHIVEAFLASEPTAVLEEVDTCGVAEQRVGANGYMVYLSPKVSACSGMFMAKLRKAVC